MKKLTLMAFLLLGGFGSAQTQNVVTFVKKVFSGTFKKEAEIKLSPTWTWFSGRVIKTLRCETVSLFETPSKITQKFQCTEPKLKISDYAGTNKLVYINKKGAVTTYRIGDGPLKGMELRWGDPQVIALIEIQTPGYTSVY